MKKILFNVIAAIFIVTFYIAVVKTIHMSLLVQILLLLGCIAGYGYFLIVFPEYKMKKTIKRFNPPNLWPVMREFYESISDITEGDLSSLELRVNASKGSFNIWLQGQARSSTNLEQQDIENRTTDLLEAIHYWESAMNTSLLSGKLVEGGGINQPDNRGNYVMAKTINKINIFSIEIVTVSKVSPETIEKLETLITSKEDIFINMYHYAQQLKIAL